MIQNLGGEYNTPSTSNQQQPKLFNRMSEFFQKRQRSLLQEEFQDIASTSNHSAMMTSSIGGAPSYAPSQYSAMDEDTASRVDSMFSSLQSNRSNMRPNPNTPPPLRTVCLDGGNNMVQRPHGAPPSPPDQQQQQQQYPYPSTSSSFNQQQQLTDNNNLLSMNNINPSDPEGIEQQFEKMAREYELSDEIIRTLTLEKKQELLRNSQVQHNKNNQGFFSWSTLGFQKKQKNRMDIRQDQLFDPNNNNNNHNNLNRNNNSNNNNRNNNMNDKKSFSTSARGKAQRASIINPYHQKEDKNSTLKYDRTMKKGLSPEYFIHVLKETHVRDLDESLVQDLRVCLRSVKASWTTQFLDLGGYNVISNLFYQMKEAPKRYPNDDKILQHLAKCFKAIMTHKQRGVNLVLTNPIGLVHIRNLLFDLFGPNNQKQKELYGLHIITRGHLLNILCSLTNIQTTPSETVPYIHGYDVLRRLLLDNSSDYYGGSVSTSHSATSITSLSQTDHQSSPSSSGSPSSPSTSTLPPIVVDDLNNNSDNELPFRMTLKEDPEVIMKVILESDPLYINGQPLKPRYAAWMRELDYTVEKEIGTITYLSQALDYRFESAFRQMRIKPPTPEQDYQHEETNGEEVTNVVMTDDGVVDYLIAHLRLINTIIGSQPTFCDTPYTDRDKEKVRLEIMMSGFDKTSKLLQNCPHPTLFAFYIPYLRTLLQPLADLSIENQQQQQQQQQYQQNNVTGSTLINNDQSLQWEGDSRQANIVSYEHPTWSTNSFYDDDDEEDDDENWVDEDESFEYGYDDDHMDEYDSHLGDEDDMSNYEREQPRWKSGPSVTR